MPYKTLAFLLAATLTAAPLAAQQSISAGQSVESTLDVNDPRMEDGAYYEAFVIRGRPGENLLVRMRSDEFDTYLYWGRGRGDDWEEESSNDDHGEGTDSRLVVRLDDSGEYQLRAAGFDEEEVGEFTLQVSALSGEVNAERLRVGQTVQGELSEDDFEGPEGVEDHYVIQGRPGAQITVYAESDDFDTYLQFGTWAGGELDVTAQDDDGAEGTNSEMQAEFGADGVHHVVVRSFSGEETGDYILRVVEGAVQDEWDDDGEGDEEWVDEDEEDSDGEAEELAVSAEDFSGTSAHIVPVRGGERISEVLGGGDARDGDGIYYQQFTYQARAGERLTIRVESDEFDAFVRIGRGTHNEFETLAEDDDGGGDLNAELAYTVPRAGEYVIQVSSAAPGQTGPFVLLVRSER
jgi:3'-phosphoadenosine 5'-phosphosulfate sulfotransferase